MPRRPVRRPSPLGPVTHLEDRLVPATAFAVVPGNSLVEFSTENPAAVVPVTLTGLGAGETLVGIDFRPQNGLLYGLTTTAVTGGSAVRLYAISVQTGFATPLTPAALQFGTGATPIPITGTNFGVDFNPAADRLRVTTDSGFNFRMDPNTGLLVAQDAAVNPATTVVSGTAYTNNEPNEGTTAPVTTLYTLDAASDRLSIQSNPNGGTQTNALPVTLNGAPLDFAAVNGFDIPAGVDVTTANVAATGRAFAALTTSAGTRLYGIELSTGVATDLGPIAAGTAAVSGLAVQSYLGGFPAGAPGVPSNDGIPAVALSADGTQLIRFNAGFPAPGSAPVPILGVSATETLVGIDFRPATGQLFGLGVNAAADTATLYRIDPQTGAAAAVGATGGIAFVTAAGAPVDLPAAAAGYGFDFNPTADRVRVTTGTGLNFRLNPDTGAAVDGDPVAAGTQPDGAINGGTAAGATGTAYTNSFGQPLGTPAGATTQYTLDATTDRLFIQNPSNAGTQTNGVPVTRLVFRTDVGEYLPFDFTAVGGFDIPAGVRTGAAAAGRGYALLTDAAGTTLLYSIDLATGRATSIGATVPAASGLALGDSPVGEVAFQLAAYQNGSESGTSIVTLTRTGGSVGAFSVTVTVTGGTATAGADYGPVPTTVTFADGQTEAQLLIPVLSDNLTEGNETVTLALSAPTGGAVLAAQSTATLTIVDNPPATGSVVGFSAPTFTVNEFGGAAGVTLTRTGGTSGAFTVTVTVTGGTATAGADFGPVPVTVTFADGQSQTQLFIPIVNDTLVEGPETVNLTLSAPTNGATLATQSTAVLTIVDDDTVVAPGASSVQFAADAFTVDEAAGAATVTLTRTGDLTAAFTVTVAATGGTATAGADFGTFPTTVTFAAGQATATVTIPIVNDTLVEGPETVVLTVANPSAGGFIGTPSSATLTIVDDDGPPLPRPAAVNTPFLVGGMAGGVVRPVTGSAGAFSIGGTTFAFPGIAGNARVAVADVNGDGTPDYIGGAGPGGTSLLVVLDGKTGATIASFVVFESSFVGGVYVAAADIDGDGKADIVVTPDQGGGPVVAVYSGARLTAGQSGDAAQVVRFLGIDDPAFRGGARAALADLDGDGRADLVVAAGFLGGPRVAIFRGASLTAGGTPVRLVPDFFAFEDTLRNGAFVSAGDITGDGRPDLVFGAGPGGGPRVRVFDGGALLAAGAFNRLDDIPAAQRANFYAGDPATRGGVRVAARDADGDGLAELLTGSGAGDPSRLRLYKAANLLANPTPAADQEFDPFGATLPNGVFVG